jgi:hypothetical protein
MHWLYLRLVALVEKSDRGFPVDPASLDHPHTPYYACWELRPFRAIQIDR